MDTPRRSPYSWVTWLTGILSADDSCRWAPWFKSQHTYAKRPDEGGFDLTQWKAAHGDLVNRTVAELRADGWEVSVEGQNKFTVRGRATTLAGQPDIVATRGEDVLFVDCKTGSRKAKDQWQVVLYMFAVPLARQFAPGARIAGRVQYGDGAVAIAAQQFTDDQRVRIVALLAEVGGAAPAERVPSYRECSFCDIAGCEARVTVAPVEAVVDAF